MGLSSKLNIFKQKSANPSENNVKSAP